MPTNAFIKGLVMFDFTDPIWIILYFWLGTTLIMVGLIIGPLFFGRHFCGWLCPAGFFTEYLNKLVPKKLQIPFDKLDVKAIRYGFFTAFLLIPIFGLGNMTCAFCNFNIIQGIFGLASLNADYLSVFATQLGWITLAWVFIFGVFSAGGRGYCNLFCPPGILSSIFHWGGSRLKRSRKIKIDKKACNSCGECVPKCPMRAVDANKKEIDLSACITCHECQPACPKDAIAYEGGKL
jgi:polyferredoxin